MLVGRVGRNERGDVDFEVEEVTDDVAILRLVQAVKRLRLVINYCRMNGLYALGDQIADQHGLG